MATININQIKFNLFNVALGTTTARVSYSLDNRTDGRKCVTLYARDYTRMLSAICGPEVSENNSDSMTDYFEKDRVTYFEGHPLYAAARATAERGAVRDAKNAAARRAKWDAQRAARKQHLHPVSDDVKCAQVWEAIGTQFGEGDAGEDETDAAIVDQCAKAGLDVDTFITYADARMEVEAAERLAAREAARVDADPEPAEDITRFDYPQAFRVFIAKAVEIGALDAVDVVALGAQYGTNHMAIIDDVIGTAYINRHVNPEQHRTLCPLADECAMPSGTITGAGGMNTANCHGSGVAGGIQPGVLICHILQ